MRICIATGIYPPATSGPAQYAAAMEREFAARGHEVRIVTYDLEHRLPSGIRHMLYFFRVLPAALWSDAIFALDTFSVGFPACAAAHVAGKKIIIRTGGDFLYEQYTERTRESVLLSKFYTEPRALSFKEKIIFALTRWTLQKVSALVFSTKWQREIFMKPYGLEKQNIFIVENRFDEKISDEPAHTKNFIFPTRPLSYKNIDRFRAAFDEAKKINPEISLEIYHALPHEELMEKIKTGYAVVMPSLGEISPHVILDAIRCNKPFILTRESGYAEKLEEVGVFVDPLSVEDMTQNILLLADDAQYARAHTAVQAYNVTHSWGEIADELLIIYAKI